MSLVRGLPVACPLQHPPQRGLGSRHAHLHLHAALHTAAAPRGGTPRALDTTTTSCSVSVLARRQPPRLRPNPLCAYGSAAASGDEGSKGSSASQTSLPALLRFTRPHTMAGTAISVVSISLLALQSHGLGCVGTQAAVGGLAQALVSALLMNIAIVGINQIFDIDIDKINKPYLPLASGELSLQNAIYIVVGCALGSLAIGIASSSPPLLATLVISLILGIVYSTELPFMRWKRSPVLAAGCILVVRALAVQLGFYYHMQNAIGASQILFNPAIAFTVGFMLLFSIVIALFKDVPDAKGDNRAGVRTLTVQLGADRVFWACIWILTLAYAGAVVYSLAAASNIGTLAASSLGSVAAGSISSIGTFAGGSTHSPPAPATPSAPTVGGIGSVVTALLASLSLSTHGMLGARTLACVGGHIVMAFLLWRKALQVNLDSQKQITDCYMFVWKLFYAEYLLIPLLL